MYLEEKFGKYLNMELKVFINSSSPSKNKQKQDQPCTVKSLTVQRPFPCSGPWRPLPFCSLPPHALPGDLGSGQVPGDTEVVRKTPRAKLPPRWGPRQGSFLLTLACWSFYCQPAKGMNMFLTKSSIVQPRLRGRTGPNPYFPV